MKSHDVRRLKPCDICGTLGMHKGAGNVAALIMVCRPPSDNNGSLIRYIHPRCYIKRYGLRSMLVNPDLDELESIRICDVSAYALKKNNDEDNRYKARTGGGAAITRRRIAPAVSRCGETE